MHEFTVVLTSFCSFPCCQTSWPPPTPLCINLHTLSQNHPSHQCHHPLPIIDLTLYQGFFSKKPKIDQLAEFGRKCWVKVPDQWHTKLELKSEQHIFTGVSANSKAWRYYNTTSHCVQMSRDIILDDTDNTISPAPHADGHPCCVICVQ